MIFPNKDVFYLVCSIFCALILGAPSFVYAETSEETNSVQFPAFVEFGIPGGLSALLHDETTAPAYRPLTQELKEDVSSLENSEPKRTASSSAAKAQGLYNLSRYASAPGYPQRIERIVVRIPQSPSVKEIDGYIQKMEPTSPITGTMVVGAALAYDIDHRYILAIMMAETQLGTDNSKGSRGNNYGNVGNSDGAMAAGKSVAFSTPQAGVDRVARWLYQNQKKSIKTRQLARQSNQGSKIDITILARF
ncbi:MAG: hypothetical protein Q7S47_01965 [bacterium]|nr:hypothetical protein [bacterium]